MKNLQQNLLIFLALALCGLCAWQWYFQTLQRNRIDKLDTTVFKQDGEIQSDTNSIAAMQAEISGQESRIDELKQTVMSNSQAIVARERENLRLQISADGLSNEIVQYQSVTNLLAGKLKEAYDGIKKQNDAITNLVAQRDEFVGKYNDSVKARNDVVAKYNDLVRQMEKFQAAQNSSQNK
jgi:chromosome segregation ATPase